MADTLKSRCDVRGGVHSTITFGNSAQSDDEWKRSANPWTVELRYQGRKMTVPFWSGPAAGEPTTETVLDRLLSDASGADQSFEDWCGDYGYDTDSRSAERIYRDCQKIASMVQRLLGDDFTMFAFDLER